MHNSAGSEQELVTKLLRESKQKDSKEAPYTRQKLASSRSQVHQVFLCPSPYSPLYCSFFSSTLSIKVHRHFVKHYGVILLATDLASLALLQPPPPAVATYGSDTAIVDGFGISETVFPQVV